jgi:hypothetical protein
VDATLAVEPDRPIRTKRNFAIICPPGEERFHTPDYFTPTNRHLWVIVIGLKIAFYCGALSIDIG